MKRSKKTYLFTYIFLDYLSAFLGWLIFYGLRKYIELGEVSVVDILNDTVLHKGLLVIPFFWLLAYLIFDKYDDPYRFSRLATLQRTLCLSFGGTLVLFFTLLSDDLVYPKITLFQAFFFLLVIHAFLTSLFRMVWLTVGKRRLDNKKVMYNTLIIGGDKKALDLYQELEDRKNKMALNLVGFVSNNSESKLERVLPKLGSTDDLSSIIEKENVSDVILAIEYTKTDAIRPILDLLFDYKSKLNIKVIPDMYDLMLGTVKMNHVFGAVLIKVENELIPKWQGYFKRGFDVIMSGIVLVCCSPLYLYAALRVKLSSKGPIFYKQERVGKDGVPFYIIKFRSMYVDAEKNGPQLSSDEDDRTTKWGKVMRKWRVDELPQFWNVLKGEMSIVGPRPERQYYIDQIVERAPHYKHLLKVRPGITSWGQVKYGYASNVDEMIQRLKFDILYIENMSLSLDIKILIYTILVVIQGKGK